MKNRTVSLRPFLHATACLLLLGLLIVPLADGQPLSPELQVDDPPSEVVLDEQVLVAGPVVRRTERIAESETSAGQTNQAPMPQTTPTVGVQGGRYGLGLASSWPAYGISGTLHLSENLTAEALIGAFGAVTNFGGRLWYRFKPDESYDLYGYGAVGLYRYGYFGGTESVLGLGGGAGIEAGLRQLFDEDFPPIFVNAEIGLALASFEFYNFSSFIFGTGIHYRFGGN